MPTATNEQLNYWLSKFIYELRKDDNNYYPRDSLISIVAGINSYISKSRPLNFFKDEYFSHFMSVLDLTCKRSHEKGVGVIKKQAEVISKDEEELMWNKGILGDKDSQTLIDTVLYLNGLHFALRSGKEHRSLRTDQIRITEPATNEDHYIITYTESVSKTNAGGLKHRFVNPKVVKHIDTNSVSNPKRSHALLLKKYLSLRPVDSPDAFYLTPISSSNKQYWYKRIPIGHNTLGNTVKRMCASAGIEGHKTNHSLRSTCATRLFEQGVDEQLIMERTGHRSTAGVRSYKRTSDIHHLNTSVIIDNHSIKKARCESNANFNFIFHDGCNVVINNYQRND